MESDRSTPQTPPLMEPRRCSHSNSTPVVKHRKTSSGFWDLDMEKLMAFPIEALPPDEEVDPSQHLSDKLQEQGCMDMVTDQDINTSTFERRGTTESEGSDGVDTVDGGSISWPPTPSCGSYNAKTGNDYEESDQETVIEDEDLSSAGSLSEEDFDLVQKDWNMNCTLVDDAAQEFPFDLNIASPFSDFDNSDRELPDYVGIAPDSALMSIPEDAEVCLDKTGNHVSSEAPSTTSAQLECIERDAAECAADIYEKEEREMGSQEEAVIVMDRGLATSQSQKSSKFMRRPVSHKEAVEAMLSGITRISKQSFQARHSKNATLTDFSDIYQEEDLEMAYEVVLSADMNSSSVHSTTTKDYSTSHSQRPTDDVSASVGCCAGLKRIPTFGKTRRRIEALGRAIKKHWPVITSAVVPLVLFFSCRGNK